MNRKFLAETQFQVEDKTVSFVSPAWTSGDNLHIFISKSINGIDVMVKELKISYRTHGNSYSFEKYE
jgi:hypothetical protein